jgi:hypothetical protein
MLLGYAIIFAQAIMFIPAALLLDYQVRYIAIIVGAFSNMFGFGII